MFARSQAAFCKNLKPSLLLLILSLLCPISAQAQPCANPAGIEGDIVYNDTQNVPQYCNGKEWISFGQLNPSAGGSACSSPAGVPGDIIYNNSFHVLEYCDGDDWRAVGSYATNALSGPVGCATIGSQCADTTIFAGWHPLTHQHLFIPPTDQGGSVQWKTSTGTNDIATDSLTDGRANTNQAPNSTTFPAFKACKDLNVGGYTDWYLPSRAELDYMFNNKALLEAGPMTDFNTFFYWSSSEWSANDVWGLVFADGNGYQGGKTSNVNVRCMRR